MTWILITIFKTVLFALVLFCSFLFLAGFSEAQSLVLTVIVVGFYIELRWRTIPADVPFVPYRVFVEPNLHLIATDFALVEDTAEAWNQIWIEIEKVPKAPWNLWHRGSGFSFSRFSPELVYNNRSNTFATKVKLWASLELIALPFREGRQDMQDIYPLSPALSLGEYGISIELVKWHWDKIRHNPAFKEIDQEKDVHVSESTVEVHLATIPYREFDPHFVKTGTLDFKDKYEQAIKRRKESRDKFGWKGKDQTGRYGEDIPAVSAKEICIVTVMQAPLESVAIIPSLSHRMT
jgi:hypothetical protein